MISANFGILFPSLTSFARDFEILELGEDRDSL